MTTRRGFLGAMLGAPAALMAVKVPEVKAAPVIEQAADVFSDGYISIPIRSRFFVEDNTERAADIIGDYYHNNHIYKIKS